MAPLAFQQYIDSFVNYEILQAQDPSVLFDLSRVRALLEVLGNPHAKFPCLHVAGTKGKGSTCAFIAHILRKAGYRVGLYTSPHLNAVEERIRLLEPQGTDHPGTGIFPDCITDDEMMRLLEAARPCLERFRLTEEHGCLTYFEALTALALVYFAGAGVDIVVLETGMGGRLDATSAVDPLACAVTSISMDHTLQLGPTLTAIAREKAAIIKKEKPVVVAPQEPEVMAVIRERCREVRARPIVIGRDITVERLEQNREGQRFRVRTDREKYDIKTSLPGSHQAINAAVAVGLAEVLIAGGWGIGRGAVQEGIAETFWPGRFEIIPGEPTVVLDVAHNPASIRSLTEDMNVYFPGQRKILVLGLSRDKDVAGICRNLKDFAGKIVLARADHPRAYDFSEPGIRDLLGTGGETSVGDIRSAVAEALAHAGPGEVILVTGSVFVVARAREALKDRKVPRHPAPVLRHP